MYLQERRILLPSQLNYQEAVGFLEWRTTYKKRKSKTVKLNTALNDIKVLRIVMRQAVRLGYTTGNPVDRLGVAKEEAKESPFAYTSQDNEQAWKKAGGVLQRLSKENSPETLFYNFEAIIKKHRIVPCKNAFRKAFLKIGFDASKVEGLARKPPGKALRWSSSFASIQRIVPRFVYRGNAPTG